MNADAAFVSEIVNEWSAIDQRRRQWNRVIMMSGGSAGGDAAVSFAPRDEFYHLPLVLAYCTLDNVLRELIKQGTGTCIKGRSSLAEHSCGFISFRNA